MTTFTKAEQKALATAKVAVWEDRIICNAQPPITARQLKAVESKCVGKLPKDLVSLWKTAFGGELAYDLRVVPLDGTGEISVSFSELFFPGSNHYRDLDGWIEHEKELRDDVVPPLAMLPIGGAEFYSRVYVNTGNTDPYGSVWSYVQGIAIGQFGTRQDSIAHLAPSLRALWKELSLNVDPRSSVDATGTALLDRIATIGKLGPAGRTAAAKLQKLVDASVLDWRSALDKGTIGKQPRLRRLAIGHAASTGDLALLDRLKTARVDLAEAVDGSNGLEQALREGHVEAARRFLAAGASAVGALRAGAGVVDLELARELLQRGAMVDAAALIGAARKGDIDVAVLLQKAAPDLRDKYAAEAALERARTLRKKPALAKKLTAFAKRVTPSRAKG